MNVINILVVDDDQVDRLCIAHELKKIKNKIRVFETDSGDGALEIMEFNKIHILISDHQMPLINGFELCELVNNLYPSIYKIIITGVSIDYLTEHQDTNINVKKYLEKPIDKKKFRDAIIYYINKITG
ncbi:MAG: response regulator [bacterium]|nr:response regulator [bacterium]